MLSRRGIMILLDIEDVGLLWDRKTYRTTLTLKRGRRKIKHNIDIDRAIQDHRGAGGMMKEFKKVFKELGITEQVKSNWRPVLTFNYWSRRIGPSPSIR